MPISLKCTCGAILQIDDRFRGQKIPCPDCQRPLAALPPIESPPRRWPSEPLIGLALGLGGLFTFVGPLAGIALGLVSVRRLDRSSFPGERRLAYASIGVGGFGLLFGLWTLFAPDVLGIDGFLRVWRWAGKLNYSEETATVQVAAEWKVTFKIPGPRWGRAEVGTDRGDASQIVYVDPWVDGYLTALSADADAGEGDKHERNRRKAIERFLESELAKALRGSGFTGKQPTPEIRDVHTEEEHTQEFLADFELGGIRRTFLFRVWDTNPKILIFVGGARRGTWTGVAEAVKESLRSGRELP